MWSHALPPPSAARHTVVLRSEQSLGHLPRIFSESASIPPTGLPISRRGESTLSVATGCDACGDTHASTIVATQPLQPARFHGCCTRRGGRLLDFRQPRNQSVARPVDGRLPLPRFVGLLSGRMATRRERDTGRGERKDSISAVGGWPRGGENGSGEPDGTREISSPHRGSPVVDVLVSAVEWVTTTAGRTLMDRQERTVRVARGVAPVGPTGCPAPAKGVCPLVRFVFDFRGLLGSRHRQVESAAAAATVSSLGDVQVREADLASYVVTDYAEGWKIAKEERLPILVVLNPGPTAERRVDMNVVRRCKHRRHLLRRYVVVEVDCTTVAGADVAKRFNATTLPAVSVIDREQKYTLVKTSEELAAEDWNMLLEKHRTGDYVRCRPSPVRSRPRRSADAPRANKRPCGITRDHAQRKSPCARARRNHLRRSQEPAQGGPAFFVSGRVFGRVAAPRGSRWGDRAGIAGGDSLQSPHAEPSAIRAETDFRQLIIVHDPADLPAATPCRVHRGSGRAGNVAGRGRNIRFQGSVHGVAVVDTVPPFRRRAAGPGVTMFAVRDVLDVARRVVALRMREGSPSRGRQARSSPRAAAGRGSGGRLRLPGGARPGWTGSRSPKPRRPVRRSRSTNRLRKRRRTRPTCRPRSLPRR